MRAADTNGLATLVQTRPISALFSISETHLDLLRQAQTQAGDAALQVQAWDADERRLIALGTLQALDNQIHVASGTVKLRALFENADEALFPNPFVNIRLALARPEDVLSIPTAAVQYGAEGAFVFVIGDDQRAARRELALGRANAGRVEVRSGQMCIRDSYTEGQAVQRGQLLAEIDPRPYQAALAAAEGELARIEALLGNAEIDLRRYRQLARQEACLLYTSRCV